jgi:drug/metabolite transporter (DMT)-like permease
MNANGRTMRLAWESVALVVLLASTWLIVGASLHDASTAIVSAGRTGFTVLGLLTLTWWSAARSSSSSTRDASAPAASPRYRWWQLLLLALTGVTAYTVLSTVAISLAGPALPTLVMALTPAVVLIAETLMTRTRPSPRTIVGTALAVAGAVVYVVPKLSGTLGSGVGLGALIAVAAMMSMAFYTLYFAKVNRNYKGAMAPRILPVFAVGTIPLAIWASARLVAGDALGWASIGMLAFLGIVIYVPVYLLQHRILLTAGPSYTALLGLATPVVVGASAAALQLAAVPAPTQIAGMLLTLFGMFLVIRRTLTTTGRAKGGPRSDNYERVLS